MLTLSVTWLPHNFLFLMAASLISLLWFLTPDTSPDLVKLSDIILGIDGLGLFPKVSTFFFFF